MVEDLRIKEVRFCGLIQSIGDLFLKGRDRSFREFHGIKGRWGKGSLQNEKEVYSAWNDQRFIVCKKC
jgi:hypothetical protein